MIRTYTALVLRSTPFAEGSAMVSFLTEHGERLSGVAKGAKKSSAKWVSAFEPLGLVKVGFFGKEQSESKRITRCDLVSSPFVLGHLESQLVIACLADLFDRVAKEGVEDERLFRLALASTRALKAEPGKALAILAYAEHWLLHLLGVMPHPRLCSRCGHGEAPLVMFSDEEGWLCAACTPVDPSEAFPLGAREHLRRLRTASAEETPDLDPADEAQHAVTLALRRRLVKELGGTLRSYEVLDRLLAV